MFTNSVSCTIERRLLVNYRIVPEVLQRHLPAPFRPQLVSGWAIGGVCFIRLGGLRPNHSPSMVGIRTENVAHRFAVEWDDDAGTKVGVFIPRRDTNSRITALAGDRIFPGMHRLAAFEVHEAGPDLQLGVKSRDGAVRLSVAAHESAELSGNLFSSTQAATDFFRRGSIGYSPTGSSGETLTGVRLQAQSWEAHPATIDDMQSTMFDNPTFFPRGSCTLDFGLVMRDLSARWVAEGVIHTRSGAAAA
jgi:hypothetical protein